MSGYQYADPWDRIRTLSPRGHYLLVRRCKVPVKTFLVGEPRPDVVVPFGREGQTGEAFAETVEKSLAGRIENPICEVLAVGPDVGKSRSKRELKRLRLVDADEQGRESVKDHVFTGAVGDMVALPESAASGRMFRGATGYEFDLLVDEGELRGAYIPKSEAA